MNSAVIGWHSPLELAPPVYEILDPLPILVLNGCGLTLAEGAI